ncbi:putative uncharacterized protein MGC34800 [Acinonyx jubatus]|uniref:Uncharacterized protein n=1 Tax=Acinonyx jubatus TaxID=32536 RepID=A0ABM3PKF0_ACIJB|nr:putative uncharacterized protein MGC34800 [Acinonyx jubatus]
MSPEARAPDTLLCAVSSPEGTGAGTRVPSEACGSATSSSDRCPLSSAHARPARETHGGLTPDPPGHQAHGATRRPRPDRALLCPRAARGCPRCATARGPSPGPAALGTGRCACRGRRSPCTVGPCPRTGGPGAPLSSSIPMGGRLLPAWPPSAGAALQSPESGL